MPSRSARTRSVCESPDPSSDFSKHRAPIWASGRNVPCPSKWTTWYGWPDWTADFHPITDAKYQPRIEMIYSTGVDALPVLIDHGASGPEGAGLRPPSGADLLRGVFPSQAGQRNNSLAAPASTRSRATIPIPSPGCACSRWTIPPLRSGSALASRRPASPSPNH